MTTPPTHLPPSELGTKEYWETFYAQTLSHLSTKTTDLKIDEEDTTATAAANANNQDDNDSSSDADDDSDPGTSWFSEHNAPEKVLDFLTSDDFPLSPAKTRPGQGGEEEPKILDLGTGNGSMLALLRKRGGFRGEMVGVDYSIGSVLLARELQSGKGHSAYLSDSDLEDGDGDDDAADDAAGEIRFEEWDILNSTDPLSNTTNPTPSAKGGLDWFPYQQGGFDIVLDKGTFDAVSLSDEVDGAAQRRVCERYPTIARRLVRRRGFLVVTSCNWTEEELVRWFTTPTSGGENGDGDRLEVWGRVEYPRFQFGGKEGQGVCTVCFQRVS